MSKPKGSWKKNLYFLKTSVVKDSLGFIRFMIWSSLFSWNFMFSLSRSSTSNFFSTELFKSWMCRWLNQAIFLGSNLALDLLRPFKEKAFIRSVFVKNSWSVPGPHPSMAKKFRVASGRYPHSLKPLFSSFPETQDIGKTGNPNLSPSLLDNFPLPSGFKISGKWRKCGAFHLNAE